MFKKRLKQEKVGTKTPTKSAPQEDAEDFLVLGPMSVSDIDAADYEMSFKFELVAGHEPWVCVSLFVWLVDLI